MKDMLKNKRIDDAQLEKVSGGVSPNTSQMDAFATDQYNDFLTNWRLSGFSDLFKNKDFEQGIIELFWDDWRDAGFEPNVTTFLRNNKNKIMGCAHSR